MVDYIGERYGRKPSVWDFWPVMYLFALVLGACFVCWIHQPTPPAKPVEQLATPKMDRIFYMRFGGIYCGNMEYTPCGVRLWNCGDDRVYVCMQDVAYLDVK